jgi:hypothetical protein
MLPGPTQRGMPVSADAIDRLVGEVTARTVAAGSPGGLAQQRGGGTVIFRRPRGLFPAAARGGAFAHPFRVADATTGGTARVAVRFGQVNSITPTIGGVALDYSTPPTLVVISGVVYLRVNLDGDGLITSAIIGNAATLPAATSTEGYLTLATVTVAANAVASLAQSVTHSLGHQKCGSTVHNFWGL